MPEHALPEACLAELSAGDYLLLCSDGLSGMITEKNIREILHKCTSPKTTCEELIAAANRAGGKDNITAVVMSFCNDAPTP